MPVTAEAAEGESSFRLRQSWKERERRSEKETVARKRELTTEYIEGMLF